jgi:hypothetical protein
MIYALSKPPVFGAGGWAVSPDETVALFAQWIATPKTFLCNDIGHRWLCYRVGVGLGLEGRVVADFHERRRAIVGCSIPVIPIQTSVLHCLRHMLGRDSLRSRQIRHGPRDLQDPVVRAGR